MTIPRWLPNAITMARIPLAIVVFVLLLRGGHEGDAQLTLRWWAAILFIFSISTDWVDGFLARKFDLVSNFGKLWDPIADKLLTGLAFVGLAIVAELPWWVVIVILVREWGITIHRFAIVSEHVVAAAWMGKIKTAVQGVALGWILMPLHMWVGLEPWRTVTLVLMIAVVVLTVVSGIDYMVAQIRGARKARS